MRCSSNLLQYSVTTAYSVFEPLKICLGLCHGLLQPLVLLCLVLHILLLGGAGDRVLLLDLVVLRLRGVLLVDHVGQVLGEVGFGHLQQADDATARTRGLAVTLH